MDSKKTDDQIAEARQRLREKFGDVQRLGGKGSARIIKKATHKGSSGDEKKLSAILKRLSLNNLSGIEEVSFLMKDGTQMVFSNPKVQANPQSKTYFVGGPYAEKPFDAAAMLGPMFQDGQVPQEMLSKLAAQFGQEEKKDEDGVPDVDEVNFEEVAIEEQSGVATVTEET